ncbi:hypothetical protein Taro_041733 [Colocasia esculenta]|uniref:TAZ-type domain-containing protein n=1 Tax=Colocasia esculenta TaxID=4460 RepID=A0A843X139_COLES|nr:hypothetical protein [Colocasia esculenta]
MRPRCCPVHEEWRDIGGRPLPPLGLQVGYLSFLFAEMDIGISDINRSAFDFSQVDTRLTSGAAGNKIRFTLLGIKSMACVELDSLRQSFGEPFILGLEESISAEILGVPEASTSSLCQSNNIPKPPPLPAASQVRAKISRKLTGYIHVPKETQHGWDQNFKEGYEADVHVLTDEKDISTSSPVLRSLLSQAKVKGGFRCIRIPGVPSEAVTAFVRFLYSSCYELNVMRNYILHLLVLSHTFSVPSLKRVCINQLEKALLTIENVIDVLQLARECDAPRLSLFCTRLVVQEFRSVSASEGWKVMKQANPALEQELLECLVEADSRREEKMKRNEEKEVYLQLYEAMEALLHICRDGCRTIGPRDKILKSNQVTCNFPACKGLESMVRHFAGCKTRVPGGCSHCKRMWQLFELHSRMCAEPDFCKVPLCRHFKGKIRQQSKKEDLKWRLLVSKVKAAKGTIDSIPARVCRVT